MVRVFFDVTSEKEDGLPDGMKLDTMGNLYCAGPGGIWVFSPDGRHLGTIKPPKTPANCTWGDGGKTVHNRADRFVLNPSSRPEWAHAILAGVDERSRMKRRACLKTILVGT
jgi:hypothetical protein